MHTFKPRFAVTLVELLIVMAIIGVLIQLLLPAVQSAREAGRRTACQNNLRQIGVSMQSHESALGYLPTAGWGWAWIGDPDRGPGKPQPGSWAYQLLPYMEQEDVYNIGRGTSGGFKYEELARLAAATVAPLYCPTRRSPQTTPTVDTGVELSGLPVGLYWYNSKRPEMQARTDYAANIGDLFVFWSEGPPPDKADNGEGFLVFNTATTKNVPLAKVTGVVIQRQPFVPAQISDGLSRTYFAGEKYLPYEKYETGSSPADDQSCWNGDDLDTVSSTQAPPKPDGKWESPIGLFGSAHPGGLNMVNCDASVHFVSFQIDPILHRQFGNRRDGSSNVP